MQANRSRINKSSEVLEIGFDNLHSSFFHHVAMHCLTWATVLHDFDFHPTSVREFQADHLGGRECRHLDLPRSVHSAGNFYMRGPCSYVLGSTEYQTKGVDGQEWD